MPSILVPRERASNAPFFSPTGKKELRKPEKNGPKLGQNWPLIDPKLTHSQKTLGQIWPKFGPKLAQRAKFGPNLGQRANFDPISSLEPNLSQIRANFEPVPLASGPKLGQLWAKF